VGARDLEPNFEVQAQHSDVRRNQSGLDLAVSVAPSPIVLILSQPQSNALATVFLIHATEPTVVETGFERVAKLEPDESGSSRSVDGRTGHVAETPFQVVTLHPTENLFGERVQLIH